MTLIDNLDRALKNQVCHLLIATHSHMLVSDLPMNRSSVTQLEKDKEGNLNATSISDVHTSGLQRRYYLKSLGLPQIGIVISVNV